MTHFEVKVWPSKHENFKMTIPYMERVIDDAFIERFLRAVRTEFAADAVKVSQVEEVVQID